MNTKRTVANLKQCFAWPKEKPNVPSDPSGWFNSGKQVLLKEVVPRDCKLLLELGSWYGQSTRWFLEHCPDATVIAVDTWLGSAEHIWKKRAVLPTLYETFLVNCWEWRDRLVPFRNTSLAAMNFLAGLDLKPDVVYFDSDHSFWGLMSELETAHELFPDAMLVGDDYEEGNSVADALLHFCGYEAGDVVNTTGWDLKTLNFSWHIDKGE